MILGDSQTISAVLTETDGAAPFGGQQVRVEQATSNGGPWSLVQAVTNDGHDRRLQPGGEAAADDVLPLRLRGHGGTYAAATSNVVTVNVTPRRRPAAHQSCHRVARADGDGDQAGTIANPRSAPC